MQELILPHTDCIIFDLLLNSVVKWHPQQKFVNKTAREDNTINDDNEKQIHRIRHNEGADEANVTNIQKQKRERTRAREKE